MGKLFGTDGVRGVANKDLTPELAFKIGRAAADCLGSSKKERAKMIVGRDPRVSGSMLEAALSAGICSMGVDVWQAGILPTPGVAFLTRTHKACAGVVISASHNPAPDNGIKFFSQAGYKLSDEVEETIAQIVLEDRKPMTEPPVGRAVGRIIDFSDAPKSYMTFLKSTTQSIEGLKVVVDCANGAASKIAPRLLSDLGAQVIPIADDDDGMSINVLCGSTHPENLAQKVVACQADVGLAFDGDADRVIAVDEEGRILNGDAIMVICALNLKAQNRLKDNTMVVTVMSNLGLHQALRRNGIQVLETAVGDRYVIEKLLATGAVLGGEQSGHIIFTEYSTTGDGFLSALQLLTIMQEQKKKLSELAACMHHFPQVLVNAPVTNKDAVMEDSGILRTIAEIKARLGEDGRILVRPSGTEQLVRVMIEGQQEEVLQELSQEVLRKIDEFERRV